MPDPGRRPDAKRVLVVGAGFSGAVIARELAEDGHLVTVQDERPHAAGNCHTHTDPATGIMIHAYGPHIFHTSNETVWAYVNRFARMMPFRHRVKATAGGRVYSLPVNLHTINQLFGTTMGPAEARAHIVALCRMDIEDPQAFEEQAVRFVGDRIYRTFFYGYTRKQWDVEPSQLPASILKRLPVRFSYDDSYFDHVHQAMQRDGYTALVQRILDAPGIDLRLGARFDGPVPGADHVVYTGPLDRYFGFDLGRLRYRSLRFERFEADGDAQGTAVMNYCDQDVPYTRIAEHRHFSPWAAHDGPSVCFREYSIDCGPRDIPYYPMRLLGDKKLLSAYVARAEAAGGVTFAGRMGTYAYLDMDVAIARALETADRIRTAWQQGRKPPVFAHAP